MARNSQSRASCLASLNRPSLLVQFLGSLLKLSRAIPGCPKRTQVTRVLGISGRRLFPKSHQLGGIDDGLVGKYTGPAHFVRDLRRGSIANLRQQGSANSTIVGRLVKLQADTSQVMPGSLRRSVGLNFTACAKSTSALSH